MLYLLWLGDLQIALQDNSFPAGLKTRRAQIYANVFRGHKTPLKKGTLGFLPPLIYSANLE
jgi:hypothetical protein